MPSERWPDGAWPWRHRELVWQFARREVLSRYRGSWLGAGWTVLTPLAMLLIYTLVFKHVFKTRWPGETVEGHLDFALQLYAGLIVFNWTAELIARAPRLILEQPNLVTKVVFPLPVLAWSALVASAFQTAISTAIWLLACVLGGHAPSLSWLAVPLVLAMWAPWLLGLSWLLGSLGVYLRDLSQLVALVLSGLMFISPVFYPSSALPAWLQPLAQLNPLTLPIEALRAATLGAQAVPWSSLAAHLAVGLLLCTLGLALMRRLQTGFADVL